MSECRSSEELEHISAHAQPEKEKQEYTPRPKWQLVLAWLCAGAVAFGFLGMCYWLAFGRF